MSNEDNEDNLIKFDVDMYGSLYVKCKRGDKSKVNGKSEEMLLTQPKLGPTNTRFGPIGRFLKRDRTNHTIRNVK
jgi:hypothetical protein